ncbi:hypothetical protein DFH08DRAFT_755614 [Mycena albidolilacea]|uniref:T6SS Phospholipase effector Tle1-like catalytic domain-containing protein n=1 Tax=Mycena albidolilacea TaxID=1033008 RepID=A0AAD6ZCH1_9AGAR|nr:hypothetical protein DFH08DRAFT_755614 [Mycena albidolilacea]
MSLDAGPSSETTGDCAGGVINRNQHSTTTQNLVNAKGPPRNEQPTFGAPGHADDQAKRGGEQPRRPTKCGCTCQLNCNCTCTCVHPEHRVCRTTPSCHAKENAGHRVSRNLVLPINGTSNQFGIYNTNVVALHGRVLASCDANQKKYYNYGIGTYISHHNRASSKYWRQKVDNALDLPFAFKFKSIILKAYHWLCETYREGDKVFLFGFSRRTYQVRTLVRMIETIGLIHAGNDQIITFFVLLKPTNVVVTNTEYQRIRNLLSKTQRQINRQGRRNRQKLQEILFQGRSNPLCRCLPLPLTSSAEHIYTFRHALALDEHRVKFLPEYVDRGCSHAAASEIGNLTDVKEVWFAGIHSDIGGGLEENISLNISSVPLLWM